MSARKKTAAEPAQPELPVEPAADTAAVPAEATGAEEIKGVTLALVAIDRVSAGLTALRDRYQGVVYPVSTTQGLADAKKARGDVRDVRLEVERVRIEAKRELLAAGKKLDGAAARITGELEAIEGPIDEQIKAEENRKRLEREAREAAEQKRVADILAKIGVIRDMPVAARKLTATAADIEAILGCARNTDIGEDFAEFSGTAREELTRTIQTLMTLHADQQQREAEAARLKAEREELERAKAAQEARAEAERQAIAKLREAEETRARAERLRVENEQRAVREAQERRDAEARAKRDAEIADQQRQLRERQEAIDRHERELREKRDAEIAAAQELLRLEREQQAAEAAKTRRQQEAEAKRLADERAAWEAQQEAARVATLPPEPALSDAPQPITELKAVPRHALMSGTTAHVECPRCACRFTVETAT